ncbi:MAG TPA: Plug domain-containing protein [Longimicrobiaceae bacterium]|jgi:hypothetical protein
MSRRFLLAPGAVAAASLAACVSSAPPAGAAHSHSLAPVHVGSGTVIFGADLARGGTLLDALAGRVSNVQVDRRSGGGCPRVVLRGAKTFMSNPSAEVYVDGTPMQDTCVLGQIRVLEVERVEVYPGATSPRQGYRASPNGSILVFLTGPGSETERS